MKTAYTHQVNFEKNFIDGLLKGHRYHDHIRFTSAADAKAFASRDGKTVKECAGSGSYIQESSVVIDLKKFA